jgi:hypothetical protein
MPNISNALTDQVLKSIQSAQADIKADVNEIKKHVGLLADGVLNIRQDIKALTGTVETIALATASHGRHLADLEDRLGRIEHHLRIPQGQ